MNSRQLREISKSIFSGITPKSGGDSYTDEQNGVRFIRSGEITDDGVVAGRSEVFLKTEVHNGIMRGSQLKENDLLIAIVGATIGKVGVYTHDEPANINQAIAAVRLDDRLIIPEYAALFLMISIGQAQLDFLKRPVARANINLEEIGDILIPVLPMEKQQKLVDKMQAARESRKQKLAQAEELLDGMDKFIFKKLDIRTQTLEGKDIFAVRLKDFFNNRIDAKYHSPKYHQLSSALSNCPHPLIPIGVISPEIAGGATPTRSETALYATKGIKFLRILNICPNEINLKDVKYIHNSVHDGILSRSKLSVDDILMTITGRVGTAAVVTTNILPANINQHIVRLRIMQDNCLPEYLAAWLNTSIGIKLSNRGVTGGTRIALDYEAIRNLEIPIPPLPVQQTIIEELLHRRTEVQHLQKEGEKDWQRAKADFEAQLLGNGTAL